MIVFFKILSLDFDFRLCYNLFSAIENSSIKYQKDLKDNNLKINNTLKDSLIKEEKH